MANGTVRNAKNNFKQQLFEYKYYYNHLWGITDEHKFVSAAVTISILSIVQFVFPTSDGHLIKVIGSIFCSTLYFFLICPITRSTLILALAICLVFSTSHFDNCNFPLVNVGITNLAPHMSQFIGHIEATVSHNPVSIFNLVKKSTFLRNLFVRDPSSPSLRNERN